MVSHSMHIRKSISQSNEKKLKFIAALSLKSYRRELRTKIATAISLTKVV